MASNLDDADEEIRKLLDSGRAQETERVTAWDDIFRIVSNTAVPRVLSWCNRYCREIEPQYRLQIGRGWVTHVLARVYDGLEDHDWGFEPGFWIVDAKRHGRPDVLRACVESAAVREIEAGRSKDSDAVPVGEIGETLDGGAQDPVQKAIDKESEDVLRACLGKLDVELREPFVYWKIVQWTLREIETVIGVSYKTVFDRAHLAERLIEKCMREKLGGAG